MRNTWKFWFYVVLVAVIPLPFIQQLYLFGKSSVFGKFKSVFILEHINGILFWQIVSALVILVVCTVRKLVFMKGNYDWEQDKAVYRNVTWKKLIAYFVVAMGVWFVAYMMVAGSSFFFGNTVCILCEEIQTMTPERFKGFLAYLPFYIVMYLIQGYGQQTSLRTKGQSALSEYARCILVNCIGVLIFAIIFYGTVVLNGISILHNERIVVGAVLHFIPGIVIGSLVQVLGFRKTGTIYVGAFTNAFISCWIASAINGMVALG